MSKTRFTHWIVLACIGTLAACTSGEGGTAGNTEFNVIVPNNESAPGVPAPIDIQTVEYTINCAGNSDTFLDNNASFPDEVRIDGNLEVVDGRTSGSPPVPTEIWQGFMDLPPGPCTVQLRARDDDGEVICTATEPFNIAADTTTKVNMVLICDVSYQAPVGMLDVDATFSFNVGNFCPDLFVLNCHDSEPAEQDIGIGVLVAATGCEVRFRDGDSTCGNNCDPQTCTPSPEGLTCTPGPDPGVSTTITCVNGTIDCDGNPATPDTECVINGDTTGALPEALFGAIPCASDADCLAATGSADVVCDVGAGFCDFSAANPNLNASFFAACTPPALGGTPGAVMTCTAVTTDGDVDCDKTKEVSITCPGLNFCDEPSTDCDDLNDCTVDSCDPNAAPGGGGACVYTNVPAGGGANCSGAPGGGLGQCDGSGVCQDFGCTVDADCEDPATECMTAPVGACDVGSGLCAPEVDVADGTSCAGGTGACSAGACVDNCDISVVDCSDGNECTADACDNSTAPGTCSNPNEPNGTSCNGGAGSCDGAGSCITLTPATWASETNDIDMCCNNNALPQQSIIPIQLTTCVGNCNVPGAGQAFTNTMTGLLTFPESFLDVAQTVVVGGVQQADLIDAQVTVQARGTGATGADVAIPAIFPAGFCLITATACDVANNVAGGGGNTDCAPVGSFNPCQRLVTVPTTADLTTCLSLDPPGCTPGTDCTKSDTHALNGFCVTGPLPIPLDTAVGNYTAGATGSNALFGWADVGVPGTTVVGGVVTIGSPVFSNPTGPNGMKVNASGLAVAIECIQSVETGDPLTDPVTCGSSADALLNGSGTYTVN